MEEFKQYYKLPLKMWEFMEIKVFTDDDKMAFDWLINVPRDIKQKLIDRINGINTEPYKIKRHFIKRTVSYIVELKTKIKN